MNSDPTKAPVGEDKGIAGDFLYNVKHRLNGTNLTGNTAIAFEVLYDETLTAIQRLENLLQR